MGPRAAGARRARGISGERQKRLRPGHPSLPSSSAPETLTDLRGPATIEDTARASGVDPDGLADTLAGRTCPRMDNAARIALALGVTLDRFAEAWTETRRRRLEREAAREAAAAARTAYL